MSQLPLNLPFEQLTGYDKPQILLTQALDNELTMRGALQTLVDVDGLTPKERDLFTTRLKDRIGRNAITDTVVDIATNPFVLLMAITNPVGGQALSRTGKAIFDMSARFSPLVKDQGGMHAALGALAPMQLFRGTALTPAVQAFSKNVDQLEKELMARVGDPLRKVLEKNGLDSLNPEHIKDAAKKLKASQLNDALEASLRGLDKEVVDKVLQARKMIGTEVYSKKKHTRMQWAQYGRYEPVVKKRVTKRYIQRDMDQEIDRLGLTELRDAYKSALSERENALFMDVEKTLRTGKKVADPQKLLRIWEGARFGAKQGGAFNGTTAEMAAMALNPEIASLIASGKLNQKAFMAAMTETIEGHASYYMPRNLMELKGTTDIGRLMEQKRSRSLVASGSTLNRTSSTGTFDPEDLQRIFDQYGATKAGAKLLDNAQKKVKNILGKGGVARTYRLNAQESLSRYFRDTGVTHALYVQTEDVLPRLGQALQDTKGYANPEKLKQINKALRPNPLMDGRKSLAKVFQEQHFLLEDRFAKEALEVILRQATGVQKIEHAATHMALIKGKQGLRLMLDSPVGKALKDSSKWGEGVYSRMDEMANAELSLGGAKGISGQLAKYFYVTHLGLNLASVTMNMMQPLLYASVYGGLGNVLKSYKSAFTELGSYMSARVGKHGFKSLNDEQHQALISKHFKFANMEGENLVQIGRDTFSTLDSISYKTSALADAAKKESYFFDYPMKLFEKAEWLNRNVAAYTVENLYKSKGLIPTKASPTYYRMINDVDEMVSATQFGGSNLNTPMVFQGEGSLGRLGNNPLFRQFLSFPLRTTTGMTYEAARLGDRGLFKGVGQDLIRGLGISAIFYEAGKNTFGVDLSPGLFGASLGQLVGGDRFFQDGNEYVPIPPVIDIPVNIVRGALDPGQRELLQNNIPRLIPGGIGLARMFNLMPNLPESPLFNLPGALQKTYIDPRQRSPEGGVALFKGDGTLIGYESPGQIYAKALGVDLGTFKQAGDFDGYLLKNRDQIVNYRQRAIQALLSNEIPRMQAIKSEFKKRYGMDLTISKEQLDSAQKNRLISRTERILDRMPPDQRAQFQQQAVSRAPEMGLEAEVIMGADTARERMQGRLTQQQPMSPEQVEVMRQETGNPGYQPFSTY